MVPNGWELNTVNNLFNVHLGKMLNQVAKAQNPQYNYLGNSDVKWGYFNFSQLKSMHFNEREINKFTLQIGDILMCEGGEVGRCSIWNSERKDIYYQKALHRLRSKGGIIPEYFYNFMSFIAGTKALDNFTTRTSIAHLTREKLLKISIKTPPLPEQQKIAKILSTWDKAIRTTEALIDNSKQQKKALMQQLLTGKKRFTGFEGEWEEKSLEQSAKFRRGSFPQPYGNPAWVDEINGYPFVQVYDIAKNMRLKSNTKMKISDAAIDKSVFIPKESIVVSIQGSIGRVAITQYDAYVDRTILLFQEYKVPMNKVFFAYTIQALFEIEKTKAPGGTIKTITKEVLRNFKIMIPCLEEQQKIANVLTNADKEIELLEKQLADLKQEKKALMQQLLTGKRRVKTHQTDIEQRAS